MHKTKQDNFLRNQWYIAASSKDIKKGGIKGLIILGEPIILGRCKDGKLFSISDNCPHRGTLLSLGKFDGKNIECPYHGWQFNTLGECILIPSQMRNHRHQADDIKTKSYLVKEHMGVIWVYIKYNDKVEQFPHIENNDFSLKLYVKKTFDCNVDLTVTGLMDPAHGSFIHASTFWRNKRDTREKEKRLKPIKNGWKIETHKVSSNSKAYKLFLGSEPETKISYFLPGIRHEITTTNKYFYSGLTACTPIDNSRTTVHHFMYWNVPGGIFLKNIIKKLTMNFLNQDAKAVLWMKEGKKYSKREFLIDDADLQIKWYYELKRNWHKYCSDDDVFINPARETVARWKS